MNIAYQLGKPRVGTLPVHSLRARSDKQDEETHAQLHLGCVFTNGEFLIVNLLPLTPVERSDHATIAFSFIGKNELRHSTNNRRWHFK